MRKMLVVAIREYLASVKTKAFLVGLLMMPVLMGGSVVIQKVLTHFRDTSVKKVAVLDRSPGAAIGPKVKQAVEANHQVPAKVEVIDLAGASREQALEMRAELSERVRDGELIGFLEIGPNVYTPVADPSSLGAADLEEHGVRYQTNRPADQVIPQAARQVIVLEVQRHRCEEKNLDLEEVAPLLQPVELHVKGLSSRDDSGAVVDASEQATFAPVVVPVVLLMLMFMTTLMGATPLMQGVVEEKMQRIAEVLLGSIQPFGLMMGKLIGMAGVSLTIALVYLGGACWAAYHFGFLEHVSLGILFWFVIFQILTTLMYGSLFIAIGAACTDMRETQNLMWPVMILACIPMFALGNVIQEPNSTAMTVLSFFPFATPTLMVARLAVPPGLPPWQPVLGVVIVVLTTLGCVWAAGRIFRVGLLMQGKGARFGEMVRWVFKG